MVSQARVGLSPLPSESAPTVLDGLRATSRARSSYWLEGGLVTSAVGLIAISPFLLDGDRPVAMIGAGILAGGAFFAPGALLGGLIAKHPGPDCDAVRDRVIWDR